MARWRSKGTLYAMTQKRKKESLWFGCQMAYSQMDWQPKTELWQNMKKQ